MSVEFSRRDFMRFSALGMGGVVSVAASYHFWPWFGQKLSEWASPVDAPVALEKSILYPDDGWLESRNPGKPHFLDAINGHEARLKYMCLNDPLFTGPNGIMHRAFIDFFNCIDNPPLLGEAFARHVQYAADALGDTKQFPLDCDENRMLRNILHVAFYSFAAVYSPYFTKKDLIENFAVDEQRVKAVNRPLFYRFPIVYQVDPKLCNGTEDDILSRCRGGDRAVHVANFAYLVHNIDYAVRFGLADISRIPRGAKLLLLFGTPEGKAYRFAKAAQFFWEWHETVEYGRGKGPKDRLGNRIPTGFYDLLVFQDFGANTLGTEFALSCSGLVTWEIVRQGINRLNGISVTGVFSAEPIR